MTGRPWVEPVVLEGSVVRLEPLSLDHLPGLISVGLDADIWRWMPVAIQTPGDMRTYVETALAGRDFATPDDVKGMALPVLEHRIILRPEFEIEGLTIGEVIHQVLQQVAVPR